MASEIVRNPLSEQLSINQLVALGPVQPINIDRKSTTVLVAGRLKSLRFQDKWYDGRPWLEHSIEDDKACCFYCRIFRPSFRGMQI